MKRRKRKRKLKQDSKPAKQFLIQDDTEQLVRLVKTSELQTEFENSGPFVLW